MKISPLLLLPVFLICSTAKSGQPVYDIPKIDGVSIDGNGADWGESGFRVNALASETGQVRDPQDLDAKFRLGWDEQGLLVWVTVRDNQVTVADEPQSLSQKDSIELFLGSKAGEPHYFEVVAGPGADSKSAAIPPFLIDHSRPPLTAKPKAEVVSTRTADGYQVEARLPWENLSITPKSGMELGFQLYVNDTDNRGPQLALTWFPRHRTSTSPKAMQQIRLAAKPSPAVITAQRTSLDQGRPRVDIFGTKELLGKKITVTSKGETIATGKFQELTGRATASFLIPRSAAEISCAGAGSNEVDFSNLDDLVSNGIKSAALVFKPSVFSGEKFPPCDFDQPAEMEKSLGKCTFTPTFYDAEYHEVKTASKPGLYGAIVEVKTSGGEIFKRYVTLYRTPENLDWKLAKIHVQSAEFPPELGLNPATIAEQTKNVGDFFRDEMRTGLNHGSSAAIQFAALAGTKVNAATPKDLNRPYILNQKWWYGLKKQTGNIRTDYYVHLPAGYEKDPARKWPLILFLHGSGERGYDIKSVQDTGLPHDLDRKPDFPFIVIAPQCSPGEWWSPLELNDLLDRVETSYRVDADRVYLTGLSMGGFGSWLLATEYPHRFAAVVPICGGGDPDDVQCIKDLPIWVFHGAKDEAVPVQRSMEMVEALKKIGGNVKFTVYPEAHHDSWTQAYATPELYDWLLQQRRNSTGNGPPAE